MMRLEKKEIWFISVILMLIIALMMMLINIWSSEQQKAAEEQNLPVEQTEEGSGMVLESVEEQEKQEGGAGDPNSDADLKSVNPYFPEDLPFPIEKTEGVLGDQFPLDKMSVKRISIMVSLDNGVRGYTVSPQSYRTLVQGLTSLNLSTAKTEIDASALASDVYIRFNLDNQMYSIKYNLDTNTVELNGQYFYASRNLMSYLHLFCRPNTLLGMLGEMRGMDVSAEDTPAPQEDGSLVYDQERFKIQEKNFTEWSRYISSSADYKEAYYYYSVGDDSIKTVRIHEEAGILSTPSTILFTKNNVSSTDGISIGMSEKEVHSLLGSPNLMLGNKWIYTMADNRRFNLYFAEENLRYITLTSQ